MSCAFVASTSAAMAAAESLCLAATGQVLLVRAAGRNPEIQGAATPFRTGAPREPAAVVATSSNMGTTPAAASALDGTRTDGSALPLLPGNGATRATEPASRVRAR